MDKGMKGGSIQNEKLGATFGPFKVLAEQVLFSCIQGGYGYLSFLPTHGVHGAPMVPLISWTIVESALILACHIQYLNIERQNGNRVVETPWFLGKELK